MITRYARVFFFSLEFEIKVFFPLHPCCLLVMLRSLVVYQGISHESLVFSRIHTNLLDISDQWDPWYTSRKRCITTFANFIIAFSVRLVG